MDSSRYSFSLTTFSPSGKLVQIEYALQAVSAGSTALGIKGKSFFWFEIKKKQQSKQTNHTSFLLQATDGVVVATEKKLPSLMDETSIQKISLLTESIGVIYAGMGPDSRVLVRKGRKIAQRYFRMYHSPIPVTQIVRDMAAVMQEFTQSGYKTKQNKNKLSY